MPAIIIDRTEQLHFLHYNTVTYCFSEDLVFWGVDSLVLEAIYSRSLRDAALWRGVSFCRKPTSWRSAG